MKKRAGLRDFITEHPEAPILGGFGAGALTPFLISLLSEKYKYSPLHSILAGLGGSGLGTLGTYFGSYPATEEKTASLGENMHPSLRNILRNYTEKMAAEEGEGEQKIKFDNKTVDMNEVQKLLKLKAEHGRNIKVPPPTVKITEFIPALEVDPDTQEPKDITTEPEQYDAMDAALQELPEELDVLKSALSNYIMGAHKRLKEIGFDKEADRIDLITHMLKGAQGDWETQRLYREGPAEGPATIDPSAISASKYPVAAAKRKAEAERKARAAAKIKKRKASLTPSTIKK